MPNGFAITAEAYRYVLDQADAWPRLHAALDGLDVADVDDLARRAQRARDIVYGAALPADLAAQVIDCLRHGCKSEYGEQLTVAVRSSATAEDLPTASFAGQHETFLNIAGEAKLLDAVRRCFASLFKDRAISYRVENGFDHFKVFLSVGVMKMVRSDLASSGVMFSLDTESGFRDVVFITGAYGLGENVVQGTVDPDEFHVFKPTLRQGHRTRAAPHARRQEDPDGVCRAGRARHHAQRADARRKTSAASAFATTKCWRWPMPQSGSRTTTAPRPGIRCRWTSSGPRMASTASSTSCRRGPETVASQKSLTTFDEYQLERKGEAAGQRARSRRQGRLRQGARDYRCRPAESISGRAKYWSPTPPCPTGAR